MELNLQQTAAVALIDTEAMGRFIVDLQKPNGEIPWSRGGKTDPWDHVESAMGLCIAGRFAEARQAYRWMAETQLADGSWWSATRNGEPEDKTRDSNMATYLAVGLYHYFLITGDDALPREVWPTLESGIEFALALQARGGEIHWARNDAGIVDPMALLAGSSSIYMSLKCAVTLAQLLGKRRPIWATAFERLGHAIRERPNLFNMMKARFSMDWYYPILCGAISEEAARQRIDRAWDKFVVPRWGVRCVSDQPWVTMAEASELVLTLMAIGDRKRAAAVFDWIVDKKNDDGSYWMGVTFPDGVIWPEERTAWTTAAVLMAYDALYDLTPASRLFNHRWWQEKGGHPKNRSEVRPRQIHSQAMHRTCKIRGG